MKAPNITQGEWEDLSSTIWSDRGAAIAQCFHHGSPDEQDANGHAITAIPKLLKALEQDRIQLLAAYKWLADLNQFGLLPSLHEALNNNKAALREAGYTEDEQ